MPKVSVVILTKNRAQLLDRALLSVERQAFQDYEVVIVNDGSSDDTETVIGSHTKLLITVISHVKSVGITRSREEALEKAVGEYVAFLDDDDEWVDIRKLEKQVQWFINHPKGVLCGGGIRKTSEIAYTMTNLTAFRPETDTRIRTWMLLKNPFFTSTVMVRREAALQAGGFIDDGVDMAEDYDLWLRLGKLGEMYNFQEIFALYRVTGYDKKKFKIFLKKQLQLIQNHKGDYPSFWLSYLILSYRILL